MEALKRHLMYVAEICRILGMNYGLGKKERQQLQKAAVYHDIGKKNISSGLFSESRKLSPPEYEIVKKHAEIGAEILQNCSFDHEVVQAVRHHHEWWNGKGYPDGLKELEIPLLARIIAVADAYDAMTSPRPYRKMVNSDIAVNELVKCAGTQFDPEIVQLLASACKEHGVFHTGDKFINLPKR